MPRDNELPRCQEHPTSRTRRQLLTGGLSVLVASQAGCLGNGGGPQATPTPPPQTPAPEPATPTSTPMAPVFGEAVSIADSFAFEITAHYQDLAVSGRQYQDDHYHDIRLQGQSVEEYVVDGTEYVVTQGLCVTDPGAGNDPTSDLELVGTDPATHESAVAGNAEVTPVETTTLDGASVYVYEVTLDGVDTRYFVDVETGFLRRFEMQAPEGDIVVEYHSWGEVNPIDPPSNCL